MSSIRHSFHQKGIKIKMCDSLGGIGNTWPSPRRQFVEYEPTLYKAGANDGK